MNENPENQRKKYKKKRPRKTTIEPAAPVGTSSIHVLLGSRPIDSAFLACLPSPSYFRPPQFPFYSSCSPFSLHCLSRVFNHSSCFRLTPHYSLETPPTADARSYLLISASASCHPTMNGSPASVGGVGSDAISSCTIRRGHEESHEKRHTQEIYIYCMTTKRSCVVPRAPRWKYGKIYTNRRKKQT